MQDKMAILKPDLTYHVYSRANGNERLFLDHGNFNYFLEKYKFYIAQIAETLCYCLMPNHFHFLIRIKSQEELMSYFESQIELKRQFTREKNDETKVEELDLNKISSLLSLQFSHFLNAYAKAFNKQQNRRGSLFMRPYKRKLVIEKDYLLNLVRYIHNNPIQAGISTDLTSWKYSSFAALVSGKPTLVSREKTIALFDDLENFMFCHGYNSNEH